MTDNTVVDNVTLNAIASNLAAIAGLMNGKSAANEAAKEATGSLAGAIRELAKKVHDEGIDKDELLGGKGRLGVFHMGLMLNGAPTGTINGSGNHLKGYLAMLADGLPIDDASTAVAQDYIASDEVKAKRAAQKAFREITKGYKAKDWQALVAAMEAITAEAGTVEEVADIVAEARAA